jgi:DNA modification methylase
VPELVWSGKGGERAVDPARLVVDELHGVDSQRNATGATGVTNRLILGAAERVLPALAPELRGKVALAYVDPPFETGGSFDYLASIAGEGTAARLPVRAYDDARGLDAWLTWFSTVASMLHELLIDGGSLYVHLDAHVAHYAKVVLDETFGRAAFQREIVWRIGWVSGFKSRARGWIRNHDTLLFYAKGDRPATFHKEYVPYPPGYVRRDGKPPKGRGHPIDDVWNGSDIDRLDSIQIMSFSREKLGYPTQKNEALVARIVRASSNPGDLVIDCCAGSGTTAAVASRLGRAWIACDTSPLAVHVARKRLAALAGAPSFVVQHDAAASVGEPGKLRLDVEVNGLACDVALRGYSAGERARIPIRSPARVPRAWAKRLDGWCIDWDGGAGPFEAQWSAWQTRRGDLPLTASHRFGRAGARTVRVRAYDVLGGVATHERTVRVR